jgi:hypothetical protein
MWTERLFIGVSLAALLAGCANLMGHPDDGFRARMAAGCETEEACSTLSHDAAVRLGKCRMEPNSRSCDEENADREKARDMVEARRKREMVAHNAEVDQKHAENNATAMERQRLGELAAKFRGQCSERDGIEKAVAAIQPEVPADRKDALAIELRRRWADRRDYRFKSQAEKIERELKEPTHIEAVENLDTVNGEIAQVRGMLEGLQCGSDAYSGLAQVRTDVDAWAAKVEQEVAKERACRADGECMAVRASKPLCEALRDKRGHQEDLAKERANPAGVVNLTYLHDLGQAIQDADERIAQARRDYAKATKKPFSEARCAKR